MNFRKTSDVDPSTPIQHGRGVTSTEGDISYANYDGHVIVNSGHNGLPGNPDLPEDVTRRVGVPRAQGIIQTGDRSSSVTHTSEISPHSNKQAHGLDISDCNRVTETSKGGRDKIEGEEMDFLVDQESERSAWTIARRREKDREKQKRSDQDTWRVSATDTHGNDSGWQQTDSAVRMISPGHGMRSAGQSETSKIRSQADDTIDVTSRVSGSSSSNADAASVGNGRSTRFVRIISSGQDIRSIGQSETTKIRSQADGGIDVTPRSDTDGNSFIGQRQTDNRKTDPKRSQQRTGRVDSTDREAHRLTHTEDWDAEYERTDGSLRVISPDHVKRSPSTPTGPIKGLEPIRIDLKSRFAAENNVTESAGKSPSIPGVSRRKRTLVSLAESVDIVDSSSVLTTGENKTGGDHMKLLMEFEQWLQAENSKLSRICGAAITSSDGIQTRQSKLQKLQRRVPQGQKLLKSLLLCRPSMSLTDDLRLEDLRYRWMLYKSKLRDSENHKNLNISEEPRAISKKTGGPCSFLQRVCCAALPLQLLLLLLLLLMFLLPLLLETRNCALSNNFARSFNLMLKYEGPPPT